MDALFLFFVVAARTSRNTASLTQRRSRHCKLASSVRRSPVKTAVMYTSPRWPDTRTNALSSDSVNALRVLTCLPRVFTFLILANGLRGIRLVSSNHPKNALAAPRYSFSVFGDPLNLLRQPSKESKVTSPSVSHAHSSHSLANWFSTSLIYLLLRPRLSREATK